jgi:hypothetical protein
MTDMLVFPKVAPIVPGPTSHAVTKNVIGDDINATTAKIDTASTASGTIYLESLTVSHSASGMTRLAPVATRWSPNRLPPCLRLFPSSDFPSSNPFPSSKHPLESSNARRGIFVRHV